MIGSAKRHKSQPEGTAICPIEDSVGHEGNNDSIGLQPKEHNHYSNTEQQKWNE